MMRCWFFRRSINRTLDDGIKPSPNLANHLLGCQDCRRLYDSQSAVLKQLRDEVLAREMETPAFLHAGIMARLGRERLGSRPLPRPRILVWQTALAAAVVLAIGAFTVSQKYRAPHAKPSSPEALNKATAITPSQNLPLAIEFPGGESLRKWTARLDQPLENELHAMFQDAQSAIHLLAYNFLPSNQVPY